MEEVPSRGSKYTIPNLVPVTINIHGLLKAEIEFNSRIQWMQNFWQVLYS